VEPGAHFYRSYQLDGDGNPIDKRNAWQARSVLYVRLIPPGAADVAHFRVAVPQGRQGPIQFTAKLNYRKFSRYYTQFAYAGQPKPGQDPALLTRDHNGLEYASRRRRFRPTSPARSATAFPICRLSPWPRPRHRPAGRERLDARGAQAGSRALERLGHRAALQGDLKGAEYAFRKTTEAEPGYADGWLNVARALIQEGETDAAKPYIAKALAINPELGRIWFFNAAIQKADGDYDGALQSLEKTRAPVSAGPRGAEPDRALLFLKRDYAGAVAALKQVCDVDPEDVQMHYTLMLCYRGLGDAAAAGREEALFRRFKADEASQAITERRRRSEAGRQQRAPAVHEHESAVKGSHAAMKWHGTFPAEAHALLDGRGSDLKSAALQPLAIRAATVRERSAAGPESQSSSFSPRRTADLPASPLHRPRVHRRHGAGGHPLRPQQRPRGQEVSAGNHGLGLRLLRCRWRRLAGHPAHQQQGLDAARPPLPARALSQQSQRHVHRYHRGQRPRRRDVRHGRGHRRLRQRRPRRRLHHRARAATTCSTTGNGKFAMSPKPPASRTRISAPAPRGWITTATASSTCSSPTTCSGPRRTTCGARSTAPPNPTARRNPTKARVAAVSTTWAAALRGRGRGGRAWATPPASRSA
jgi:tetratricopeptide (TPR) repeat protein